MTRKIDGGDGPHITRRATDERKDELREVSGADIRDCEVWLLLRL